MLLATLAFLHSGGEPAAGDPAGFSRDLPEGVYRVTVEFGGDDVESTTTCKGEARRLIQGGGMYLDNERVSDEALKIRDTKILEKGFLVLRSGKKKYHLVRVG